LWPALLSLLVSLSLLVPPSQVCALLESTPDHPHAQAHAYGSAHDHGSAHTHAPQAPGSHHEHAAAARYNQNRLAFAPTELPDTCCGYSEEIPFVKAAALRWGSLHQVVATVAYAPAVLPQLPGLFEGLRCHGRDGPPDKPLRSQRLPSALLGRAPPALA